MKKYNLIFFTVFFIVGMMVINSCAKKNDCTEITWYQDADGDGFGNPNMTKSACEKPNGYVSSNIDFDDTNASAYPGASEICNDGLDNDGDGFTDCGDFDCSNTTLKECNCSDGLDNDADGFSDCNDSDCNGQPGC